MNEELLQKQEVLENEAQEISMEDLLSTMGISPLELNIENLNEVKYDEREFQKGVKLGSKYAGMITALINSGVSGKDALDFIINERTIEMNLALNTENNNANKEIARIQQIQLQTQTV